MRYPEINRIVKHQSIIKTEREKPWNLVLNRINEIISSELKMEALMIFNKSTMLV
jgi:hypothetical protein